MNDDIRATLARTFAASPSLPGEPARLPAPAPLSPAPTLPAVPRRTTTGNIVSTGCPLGRHMVDVTGMTQAEALRAAGLDWQAIAVIPTYQTAHGARQATPDRIWYRSDNGDRLGMFGNRRQPRQPADYLEAFQSFHAGAGGQLGPMHLGFLGGSLLTMAAQIVADVAQGPAAMGDRTDSWLCLTDPYGESLSGRLLVWTNELACLNGCVRRVDEHRQKLSHYGTLSADDIREILESALMENQAYQQIKRRLIETPMPLQTGENFIRRFFKAQEQVANKIVRIYRYDLRGGELETRQDNAWRVMSAVTQYQTHERGRDEDRRVVSQIMGSRARTAAAFEAELLAVV